MKMPCPLLVVHVSPVTRDVQVNAAKRQVRPYPSVLNTGRSRFEL
jgi:hypothetical protein